MSIQPIDLQTLFLRLNQVGKEQAEQKEISHQHQNLQGSEIVKKTEEKIHTVTETHEIEEGPEQIHDDDEKKGSKQHSSEQKKNQQKEENNTKEVLKDPHLGQNIDISG